MTTCLSAFFVDVSGRLDIKGRDDQALKRHTDHMVRTYYENDPNYDLGRAVLSELDQLEVVPLVLTNRLLFSVVLVTVFSLAIIIIIMKYHVKEAIVASVVVIALFLGGMYFIFLNEPNVTFSRILLSDLERNRVNRALCAYSE
jgi:glucan phosphoethanolaminetransferase (alkaline phosphatase superfamily)